MKGAVLTVLCAVALTRGAVVVNQNGCPIDSSIEKLLPHPNCSQYYQCVFGNRMAMSCPPGLHFSTSSNTCDFPTIANCQNEINNDNAPDLTDTSPAAVICSTSFDGTTVAHERCDYYYTCVNGQPVEAKCLPHLLFDTNGNVCDWAANVNCGGRTLISDDTAENKENEEDNTVGAGNSDPSEAPAICGSQGSEGVLVAHESCNFFYKCSFGNPVSMRCPGTLLYDPSKERCEWPETVECGDRVISEDDDDGTVGGDWTGNGAGNSDPSQAVPICANEGSDGIYVAHENCNQFYKCWGGVPVAMDCPSGQLFNPNKDYCDFTYNVVCGDRIIPDNFDDNTGNDNQGNNGGGQTESIPNGNNHYDPQQASTICATAGSDGVLVAHENCNQFYKCSFGLPVAMICAGTLFFDPNKDRCEWRDAVDCGDRIIPEDDENDNNGAGQWEGNGAGNDDPSQAPAICAAEGSDHVYIAHENCNKFYKCWDGLPVAMDCPTDHYFNPLKDYCDFPYNVDCGDRVISENQNINTGNQGVSNGAQAEDSNNIGGSIHNDPSQAFSICAIQGSDGVLVAHENCNQFYKCSFGLPVAMICPGILMFDPSKDRCEWRETVDCGERLIPEINEDENPGTEWTGNGAGNDDPSQAPAICAADGSDHTYIAHENCNQFYKCWDSIPVVMDCPPGYLFNPNKDYCDFTYNVECGERIIPENFGDDTNSDNNNQGGNNNDDSEDDTPIGNNHDDPSQASAVCGGEESDGLLVAHDMCNQFYKCAFGLPVAMVCAGNLLFDPTKDRCEWRETVNCGDRIIPEYEDNETDDVWQGNGAGNDDPSQAPAICAAEGSDHTYIAHENCNQFYKCWAGVPVPMDCPEDHYFNPKKDYCDFPRNVDCGDRLLVAAEQ